MSLTLTQTLFPRNVQKYCGSPKSEISIIQPSGLFILSGNGKIWVFELSSLNNCNDLFQRNPGLRVTTDLAETFLNHPQLLPFKLAAFLPSSYLVTHLNSTEQEQYRTVPKHCLLVQFMFTVVLFESLKQFFIYFYLVNNLIYLYKG